jgi:hypothetical protein
MQPNVGSRTSSIRLTLQLLASPDGTQTEVGHRRGVARVLGHEPKVPRALERKSLQSLARCRTSRPCLG